MDAQRFDSLVRGLARASTRRDLLRAAVAGLAGTVLAAVGAGPAAAQCVPEGGLCLLGCCPGLRCRDGRCLRCQSLGALCETSRECCGNARCDVIAGGVGQCRCRPGETVCNGACRNLTADPFACGTCFTQCRLGSETCNEGRCCTSAGESCPGECQANQPCLGCCHGFCHRRTLGRGRPFCGCPPGTRDCGGLCLPLDQCCADADCAAGFVCSPESRRCVGCPPGMRDCGGFCVPVDACCRDSECTSATPHCVDGTCRECPVAGQYHQCRTFPSARLGCDPETICGCVPLGTRICGLSACPLDDTCLRVIGFGEVVTCEALYFCV